MSARGRAGVTLLELILVMFLLALLFGTGLGMFASLDTGRRSAAGLVKNVLRSARASAEASQAPARVLVDAESGSFILQDLRVVGTWRFEGRKLEGGADLLGSADPELFHGDGFIGDALSFADRAASVGEIPVHLDPAFDFRDGFAFECVVRREGIGGGRLLSVGSTLAIELGQGGELRGRFVAAREPTATDPLPTAGGRVQVTSPPGVVPPDVWTRLRVSYDRRELVLEVDGVRIAATPETAPVAPVTEAMILSDARRPFPGSIDDLVVSAVVSADPLRLEPEVVLLSASQVIHFAPGGGLDRRYHTQPVALELGFEDGGRRTLSVGFFGTVEG